MLADTHYGEARMISSGLSMSSTASIASIEAVLSDEFGCDSDPSGAPPGTAQEGEGEVPAYVPPEWSPRFLRGGVSEPAPQPVVDALLLAMTSAGHGVEALSFYLGVSEDEVRERVAELGLARPNEKPLRRPTSPNPWSLYDVRLLIALWLDNVSAGSIAATFGRSRSSIHGKRRWLGLSVRDGKRVAARPVEDCRKTALPWTPSLDVSDILARLTGPRSGKPATAIEIDPLVRWPEEVKWVLGRDEVKDRRFSVLAFAGLRAPAIAGRMLIEFGVRLTVSAVNNRISRLQIVRDRRDMTSDYDAETVETRAAEAIRRLGATLRQCSELHRSFWYCSTIGGYRSTCREFHRTKKFQGRKAERNCCDVTAMA
jgi:hypothetical protein